MKVLVGDNLIKIKLYCKLNNYAALDDTKFKCAVFCHFFKPITFSVSYCSTITSLLEGYERHWNAIVGVWQEEFF